MTLLRVSPFSNFLLSLPSQKRVLELSASEDLVILAWVILAQYLCLTD